MLKDIELLFFDVGSTLINEEKAYEHRMRDMAGQQINLMKKYMNLQSTSTKRIKKVIWK